MNQKLENLYLPTNGVVQGSPTPKRCISTGLQCTGNQATQTSKVPICRHGGGRQSAKPCPPTPPPQSMEKSFSTEPVAGAQKD